MKGKVKNKFFKNLSIFLLAFGGMSTPCHSQWFQISTVSTSQLTSMRFFNANTGIAVGYGGVWRSMNGGLNWSQMFSPGQFNSVSFSDSLNGTAVGDSGIILRTLNGGLNWTQETSPTNLNLYSVSCPTANNRFAIGQNGVFLRWFVNTWYLVSTLGTDFYDIEMLNANEGYIVGSSSNEIVRNTANGGTNWIFSLLPTPGRLNSIFCKNLNTIVCVGANSRIRVSSNYGYNWNLPSVDPGYVFHSVVFPVWDTGYIAGSTQWERNWE